MLQNISRTKKVIRIEHDSGKGLFRARLDTEEYLIDIVPFGDEILEKHDLEFPLAYQENLNRTDNHYFAYPSIEVLNRWYEKEWLSAILYWRKDVRIYEIELSDWQESENQVIFLKKDIVSKTDISYQFQ